VKPKDDFRELCEEVFRNSGPVPKIGDFSPLLGDVGMDAEGHPHIYTGNEEWYPRLKTPPCFVGEGVEYFSYTEPVLQAAIDKFRAEEIKKGEK
jgi:hypothetical protein